MANIEQVKHGVSEYVKNDVLPHLPTAKQIGVSIYIGLVMDNATGAVEKIKNHPALGLTGIFKDDDIDVDRLYSVARPQFEQRRTIEIPMIGELTFDGNDVDRLYKYIKEY
nr:MAG TPA: hypothetical protein [Caudoviricetes sp.]